MKPVSFVEKVCEYASSRAGPVLKRSNKQGKALATRGI